MSKMALLDKIIVILPLINNVGTARTTWRFWLSWRAWWPWTCWTPWRTRTRWTPWTTCTLFDITCNSNFASLLASEYNEITLGLMKLLAIYFYISFFPEYNRALMEKMEILVPEGHRCVP